MAAASCTNLKLPTERYVINLYVDAFLTLLNTILCFQATYQSRALESEAYQRNTAANRIVVSEFGTHSFPDPCLSILGRYVHIHTFA